MFVERLVGDGATTTGSGGEVNAIRTLGLANSGAGTPITSANYNPDADLNRDGTITSADYTLAQAAPGSGTGGVTTAAAPGMINHSSSGTSVLAAGGVTDNIVGYCGYLFNSEVPGGGMYTVRFRNYDASIGRWLERDPAGYVDGMSLYGYCGDGPVGCSDAMGLAAQWHHRIPQLVFKEFGNLFDEAFMNSVENGVWLHAEEHAAMSPAYTQAWKEGIAKLRTGGKEITKAALLKLRDELEGAKAFKAFLKDGELVKTVFRSASKAALAEREAVGKLLAERLALKRKLVREALEKIARSAVAKGARRGAVTVGLLVAQVAATGGTILVIYGVYENIELVIELSELTKLIADQWYQEWWEERLREAKIIDDMLNNVNSQDVEDYLNRKGGWYRWPDGSLRDKPPPKCEKEQPKTSE